MPPPPPRSGDIQALSLTHVREGKEKHNEPVDNQWQVEHAMK